MPFRKAWIQPKCYGKALGPLVSITLGLDPCFPEWLQVLCHGLGFPGSGSRGYVRSLRCVKRQQSPIFAQATVSALSTGNSLWSANRQQCLSCQQGTVSGLSTGNSLWYVNREQSLVCQQATVSALSTGNSLWSVNRQQGCAL